MTLESTLQAKQDINDLVAKLGLPHEIVEEANNLYKNSKTILLGRYRAGLQGACVYAAARVAEIPLTPYLIAKRAFTGSPHSAPTKLRNAIKHTYAVLITRHYAQTKLLPPQAYVQRFCDEIELNAKCKLSWNVRESAINILNAAAEKNNLIFNQQMLNSNYAIAAIYTSFALHGTPITMRTLGDIFGITTNTIQIKHHELEKLAGLPAGLGRKHTSTWAYALERAAKKVALATASKREVDDLFERMQRGEKVF